MRRKRKRKSMITELLAMQEDLDIEILPRNDQKQKTCPSTGKHSHTSRSKAMSSIRYRQKKGAGALRPYLCQHCDSWHISSSFHK